MHKLGLLFWAAASLPAADAELGLLLGALRSAQTPDVTVRGATLVNENGRVNSGLQANFAVRLKDRLYLEVPVVAGPNAQAGGPLRGAAGASGGGYASLFVTPGLRVKLAPADSRVTPFVFAGGGYAQFDRYEIPGFAAERSEHTGAFNFGGGADVRVLSWLKLRGEIRDFVAQGQNHLFVGGGIVLRLRR